MDDITKRLEAVKEQINELNISVESMIKENQPTIYNRTYYQKPQSGILDKYRKEHVLMMVLLVLMCILTGMLIITIFLR